MQTLQRDKSQISYVDREKDQNGNIVPNKCGRDFLYYALNHYFPDRFNSNGLYPVMLDGNRAFGIPTPPNFAWTQVQFSNAPKFLAEQGLSLTINDLLVSGYRDFVTAILFSRKKLDEAFRDIETSIDKNIACGIDISLGMGGLLDHVVFVYGYDDENLYIVDTHNVQALNYEQVDSESPHLYKLSKKVIENRWTTFGRVWKVMKTN